MSELAKAYEPQPVESKWYQYWLDQNFFTADPARVSEKRPAYSIVIPPPNVTGVLHMGHVLNNTIQDILARKARMDGKEVLWLPGTDHAGISTEGMVVKQIRKEEHKTKHDLGREEFLRRVWAWKEKHGGIIIAQLKKLGCSCDWTRQRFTMDPEYVRCVQKVFVDLYKKGLIYRGKRMVNWCPASQTALSDEEVIMKEQKGFMYYFKVEVAEQPGTFLTVATTRPETIPGDTAVAVNPRDPRYAQFIGKHVVRPLPSELLREQKLIPIIGDEHVDFEFGTGVLKVTPAHDKADFEIGQRHKLAVVEVIEADGKMNALAGQDLNGLDRFAARKIAVEKLKELGSLDKEEPYANNVGFSERADVPIEPRLSEQWFLKYPSVEKSKACVAQPGELEGRAPRVLNPSATQPGDQGLAELVPPTGEKMRFFPERWAKVYDHWLTGIQDWCISRQLWWGHRIPVWTLPLHVSGDGVARQLKDYFNEWGIPESHVFIEVQKSKPDFGDVVRFLTSSDAADSAAEKLNSFYQVGKFDASLQDRFPTPRAKELAEAIMAGPASDQATQDPDVLDTWFSSWLWPFATMNWTGDKDTDAKNATLKAFYPTTDLVTAPEIIFFWVARMIMAGFEYMGDLPFRNVYFTGIIRDKQGRKMSKSLGNSPDPLDLIARYGADAVRFGTMRSAPLGQDVMFDEKDVELGRNFCNKLWNACRFRQMQSAAGILPADGASTDAQNFRQDAGSTFEVQGEIDVNKLRSDDKWILLKLHAAIKELDAALAEYKFNEATQTLYRFFYSEYCDWYVESCKAVLTRPTDASSPSPLNGLRAEPRRETDSSPAGVRGEAGQSSTEESSAPPHPGPLPPVGQGGEGGDAASAAAEARRAATQANVIAVMDFVLSHTLRLFQPFLPFITEELWHGMGYAEDMPDAQGGKSIMHAPWPKPFDSDFRDHYSLDDCYLDFVNAKFDLVTKGRNLRAEARIAANKKVKFILKPAQDLPPNDLEVIKLLLNAETLEVNADYEPGKNVSSTKAEMGELYLPLEGLVDMAAELTRLTKELEKYVVEITKVEQKLANPNFTQKVPPEVLTEHRKRLEDWIAKKDHVQKAIEGLKA